MISADLIRRNHLQVLARIRRAAERAGRNPAAIKLVAVTKTVTISEAQALVDLGVRDLGENRIQEAVRKQQTLAQQDVMWHMIGHLQRKKVNKAVGAFTLIHSVDTVRLAEAIDRAALHKGLRQDVLVQVNVSGETQKSGFSPSEVPAALAAMAALEGLRVCGFMTMAPLAADAEAARPVFAALRDLRDRCAHNTPEHMELSHLSMGMTQDFEVAVEEGADIVRIGTALFQS